MKNRITKSVPFLVSTAGKAIGGLALYAAEVQPKYVTASGINTQLTTLLDADTQYQEAKVRLKEVRATLYALTATVRQFVYVARDAVKPFLGNRYSTKWQAFGLDGSIEVPRAVDELLPLLCSIDAYFIANPGQQNSLLQATAQRAAEFYSGLRDAVNAVNHQLDVLSQLYGLRGLCRDGLARCPPCLLCHSVVRNSG